MEMTFYDDSQARGKNNNPLKRPATLDLDSPNTTSKKQKFSILTSPDLNMLKLATPEIERFIIANGNLAMTPTPSGTSQILFPKSATEEQENYAKGFIDALNQMHADQSGQHDMSRLLGSAGLLGPIYLTSPTSVIKPPRNSQSVFTNLNPSTVRPPSVENTNSSCSNSSSLPVPLEFAIKEELQTVPSDFSSPPLSPLSKSAQPIDMVDQERIKLERKRYRNRIAATKCRRRKLEKISQLEEKVKDLKGENAKLESTADNLREQVCRLKETVLYHLKKGCKIMIHHPL